MKDKKEKSVLTSEWDLKSMRSNWTVRTIGMEKLVRISGSSWIEARGDKCNYCDKGSVDIKIPILGDIVAKSVVKDIEKAFPGKKQMMEKILKG